MPESDTDLGALPKIELHLHLDCCVSFAAASRLDPSLTEAAYRTRFVAPAKCRDFAQWVTQVDPALALMQAEQGLRLLTADVFRQLRADNVVYAELRFAPLLHTRRGLTAKEVVAIVERGAAAASRATAVEARLTSARCITSAPSRACGRSSWSSSSGAP